MSKLRQLLSYLDRPDVSEIVFRTGSPASLHTGGRDVPVTVAPLTPAQILRFFDATDVLARLPKRDAPSETERTALFGFEYEVTIARRDDRLEIRVALPRHAASERTPSVGVGERAPSAAGGRLEHIDTSRTPSAGRAESVGTPRRFARAPGAAQSPPARPPSPPGAGEIDFGSLDIEPNSFALGDLTHATADAARPDAFESTAIEASSFGEVSLVSDPDALPVGPSVGPAVAPVAVPAPRVQVEPDVMPSLAAESDWCPCDVPPPLLEFLATARREGATDVHLLAEGPPRVRTAGALNPVGPDLTADEVAGFCEPLLRPSHRRALEERGYVDFSLDLSRVGRLRVNVCRQRTGLKACFRLVATEPAPVEALGLPSEVRKLLGFHQGLVVVSGPSGHGKTTSMASIVDLFNTAKSVHIVTVEDPVEVVHPLKLALMTQREVGTHTRSFGRALEAALREDPDIIVIGELRDRQTVQMALAAAETGHLVLATMSTPSGAKTIDRLIDMFPPDDQAQVRATLAGTLKLVLGQRLLRRSDGRGVVAAFEMITGNVPLWALIANNKLYQLPGLQQRGRNVGMIRLDESLQQLVADGTVEREEALRFAEDPRVIEAVRSPVRRDRAGGRR